MKHYKQAPGNPGDHPDYFFSLSGGVDSVAAFLAAKDAVETRQADGNFVKKPVAIYLDTRTGTPLNRLYVEQLCDQYDVQLWTLRTDEKFEDWLRSDGAPGSGAHGNVRNELKGRQTSKLMSLVENPHMIMGISADESDDRADRNKITQLDRHTEVYPVHRLSRKQRVELILRHEDCPIHPLWIKPKVIRDCGCLANGDVSEMDETEKEFPVFAQRLREWVEAIDYEGLKANLGWNGLTANEKRAVEQNQQQMTLCSSGCRAKKDPAEVRAFRARTKGATVEEAVSILYEPRTDTPEATQ